MDEIAPIKMSYYFNRRIGDNDIDDSNSVEELIKFFNSYSSMGDLVEIDIYFYTPGGSYPDFNVLKSLLERSPFKITIINAAECSSYGFLLFYMCENVDKMLSPYCVSTLHTISASFEDRDERRNDRNLKVIKNILNKNNEDFLLLLKTNKIVSLSEYKRIEKGEDVTLNHEQLHKIMLHCPYGKYIHK